MEKIFPNSLKLNFTPNTLGGYGLIEDVNPSRTAPLTRNGRCFWEKSWVLEGLRLSCEVP